MKNYSTEELEKYVSSYIRNRYIEFFKNLIVNYEPNHIIPGDAFDDMVKYKYQMSTLDLVTIENEIKRGTATENQKALFYKLKHVKKTLMSYNDNLQKSIKLIEDHHTKIGTPFGGILFHIYAYLVFDISAATDNYDFANIISYMYTHDQNTRKQIVEKIPYRSSRKTSRFTSNKIKKKWVEKAIASGMILDKRKLTLHWLPKHLQSMSRGEAKERGYIR